MKNLSLFFLLVGVFFLSSCKKQFEVSRTATIEAPIQAVWSQVGNLNNWMNWSPWYANDSTMTWDLSNYTGEIGSGYSWTSDNSGSGSMTLDALSKNEKIEYTMNFTDPWESTSPGYMHLSQVDGGTEVKWGFSGELGFPMSLFMNMDKMVGKDFEQGLSLLEDYVIANKDKLSSSSGIFDIQEVSFEPRTYIGKRDVIGFDEMESFYTEHFANTFASIEKSGIEMLGMPSGVYYKWDEENMETDVMASIPVKVGSSLKGFDKEDMGEEKALLIDHYGSYEATMAAHMAINEYIESKEGISYKGPVIEEYITDPTTVNDPSEILTKIYYIIE